MAKLVLRKVKFKHWYRQHVVECPVCGSMDDWKERVYGEKPKDPEDRVHHELVYDHCEDL